MMEVGRVDYLEKLKRMYGVSMDATFMMLNLEDYGYLWLDTTDDNDRNAMNELLQNEWAIQVTRKDRFARYEMTLRGMKISGLMKNQLHEWRAMETPTKETA